MDSPQSKGIANVKARMIGKKNTRDFGVVEHTAGMKKGATFLIGCIDLDMKWKEKDNESRVGIECFL